MYLAIVTVCGIYMCAEFTSTDGPYKLESDCKNKTEEMASIILDEKDSFAFLVDKSNPNITIYKECIYDKDYI